MKKSKKFLSVLCAVCMILAVSAPAFAASSDTSMISTNAGTTLSYDVVFVSSQGNTSKTISVAIPQNATPEDEQSLINSAVQSGLGLRTTRGTDNVYFIGSEKSTEKVYIAAAKDGGSSQVGNEIGDVDVDGTFTYMQVVFSSIPSDMKRINIRFANSSHKTGADSNVYTYTTTGTILVYDLQHLPDDDGGQFHIDDGDNIALAASGADSTGRTGVDGYCQCKAWIF